MLFLSESVLIALGQNGLSTGKSIKGNISLDKPSKESTVREIPFMSREETTVPETRRTTEQSDYF